MSQNEQLRALLREHQEQARSRVTKLEADLDQLTRARRSESDDDEHDPEGEPLSTQWSMRAGLLQSARTDALAADAALRRLDEGRYGVCIVCRQPIPFSQLEARPFRERCVPCAS